MGRTTRYVRLDYGLKVDYSIRVNDCSIRVSDCSVRLSRFFQPFLCLHCFSGVFKRFFASGYKENSSIIPGTHLINPEYSPILSTTLLFLKLCWHNRGVPNYFHVITYYLWIIIIIIIYLICQKRQGDTKRQSLYKGVSLEDTKLNAEGTNTQLQKPRKNT